jgi:ATP-dependent Clp protease ATP-binding subunit ClpC
MKEMKNFFSPEFINRIDDTIVFETLTKENIEKIVGLELDKLSKRLGEMKYKVVMDKSVTEYIAKVGFDQVYGARPIKRAIQDKIEDFLSELILVGKLKETRKYTIKVVNEEVKIS